MSFRSRGNRNAEARSVTANQGLPVERMAVALCRNSGSDWKSRPQQSAEPSQKIPESPRYSAELVSNGDPLA